MFSYRTSRYRMEVWGALLLFGIASGSFAQAAFVDDLPGWMGEINSGKLRTRVGTRSDSQGGKRAFVIDPTKVLQLSWKPRAFLYKGFLSEEECDHLIYLAKNKLEKSMVADNESGKSVLSEIRTSSGMFISKGHELLSTVWEPEDIPILLFSISVFRNSVLTTREDEIVRRVENKIATWTFLPTENGEALQILRYENGEKYDPHFDYFHDKQNQALGGHRIATVLMYLSDVVRGGETVFPNSPDPRIKDDTWSDCAKKGLSVKARKGDALLFYSLHPDAVPDTMSLHGSCPVIEGEKWSATKWIHVNAFERRRPTPEACVDENDRCAEWAIAGECMKNPAYMVGSDEYPGFCRSSCKVC